VKELRRKCNLRVHLKLFIIKFIAFFFVILMLILNIYRLITNLYQNLRSCLMEFNFTHTNDILVVKIYCWDAL